MIVLWHMHLLTLELCQKITCKFCYTFTLAPSVRIFLLANFHKFGTKFSLQLVTGNLLSCTTTCSLLKTDHSTYFVLLRKVFSIKLGLKMTRSVLV